jgi:hypothetical protein
MSTPAEYLVIIAPEFKNIDFVGALQVAELQISAGLCGDKRPLLVAYLAAHVLTIANATGGSAGNISSYTEGGASIKYEITKTSLDVSGLSDTKYGRELIRIRSGCIMPVRTRACVI